MPQVIATPINGARVRKLDGQILKAEGETVERDSFWLRREFDGDVRLDDVTPSAAGDDAANVTQIKPKK
jgi:hypothetical protein